MPFKKKLKFMKVKINLDTVLFLLKSEAIAYALTEWVDYKPFNVFETSYHLYNEDSEFEDDENEEEQTEYADYKIFEVSDQFQLDAVKLVQINNNGTDLLWTHNFEEVK